MSEFPDYNLPNQKYRALLLEYKVQILRSITEPQVVASKLQERCIISKADVDNVRTRSTLASQNEALFQLLVGSHCDELEQITFAVKEACGDDCRFKDILDTIWSRGKPFLKEIPMVKDEGLQEDGIGAGSGEATGDEPPPPPPPPPATQSTSSSPFLDLHKAAKYANEYQLIKFFSNAPQLGSIKDWLDENQRTPLHVVVMNGDSAKDFVQCLVELVELSCRAHVGSNDRPKNTPKSSSESTSLPKTEAPVHSASVHKDNNQPPDEEKGFRFENFLNAQDNFGNTALHLAVQVRAVGVMKFLIHSSHADYIIKNNDHLTALDLMFELTPEVVTYMMDQNILASSYEDPMKHDHDRILGLDMLPLIGYKNDGEMEEGWWERTQKVETRQLANIVLSNLKKPCQQIFKHPMTKAFLDEKLNKFSAAIFTLTISYLFVHIFHTIFLIHVFVLESPFVSQNSTSPSIILSNDPNHPNDTLEANLTSPLDEEERGTVLGHNFYIYLLGNWKPPPLNVTSVTASVSNDVTSNMAIASIVMTVLMLVIEFMELVLTSTGIRTNARVKYRKIQGWKVTFSFCIIFISIYIQATKSMATGFFLLSLSAYEYIGKKFGPTTITNSTHSNRKRDKNRPKDGYGCCGGCGDSGTSFWAFLRNLMRFGAAVSTIIFSLLATNRGANFVTVVSITLGALLALSEIVELVLRCAQSFKKSKKQQRKMDTPTTTTRQTSTTLPHPQPQPSNEPSVTTKTADVSGIGKSSQNLEDAQTPAEDSLVSRPRVTRLWFKNKAVGQRKHSKPNVRGKSHEEYEMHEIETKTLLTNEKGSSSSGDGKTDNLGPGKNVGRNDGPKNANDKTNIDTDADADTGGQEEGGSGNLEPNPNQSEPGPSHKNLEPTKTKTKSGTPDPTQGGPQPKTTDPVKKSGMDDHHLKKSKKMDVFLNICTGFLGYFENLENILQLLYIIFMTRLSAYVIQEQLFSDLYVEAAFSIVLGWILILMQIANIHGLGKYIQMLRSAVKSFLAMLGIYVTLLLAFALAFTILFPKDQSEKSIFESFPSSFFRVTSMMVGELNYDGLFHPDGDKPEENTDTKQIVTSPLAFPYASQWMHTFFVIVVVTVLMNLLIGLTVSDIQEIERHSDTIYRSVQVERLFVLEKFKACWCCWFCSIGSSPHQEEIPEEERTQVQLRSVRLKDLESSLREEFLTLLSRPPSVDELTKDCGDDGDEEDGQFQNLAVQKKGSKLVSSMIKKFYLTSEDAHLNLPPYWAHLVLTPTPTQTPKTGNQTQTILSKIKSITCHLPLKADEELGTQLDLIVSTQLQGGRRQALELHSLTLKLSLKTVDLTTGVAKKIKNKWWRFWLTCYDNVVKILKLNKDTLTHIHVSFERDDQKCLKIFKIPPTDTDTAAPTLADMQQPTLRGQVGGKDDEDEEETGSHFSKAIIEISSFEHGPEISGMENFLKALQFQLKTVENGENLGSPYSLHQNPTNDLNLMESSSTRCCLQLAGFNLSLTDLKQGLENLKIKLVATSCQNGEAKEKENGDDGGGGGGGGGDQAKNTFVMKISQCHPPSTTLTRPRFPGINWPRAGPHFGTQRDSIPHPHHEPKMKSRDEGHHHDHTLNCDTMSLPDLTRVEITGLDLKLKQLDWLLPNQIFFHLFKNNEEEMSGTSAYEVMSGTSSEIDYFPKVSKMTLQRAKGVTHIPTNFMKRVATIFPQVATMDASGWQEKELQAIKKLWKVEIITV